MLTPLEHILLAMIAMKPEPLSGGRLNHVLNHLPWILLPDAMELYIANRQTSHFETAPNGDVSWIVYPEQWTLVEMDPESASGMVDSCLMGLDPAPILAGPISIETFDRLNYSHSWFLALRGHLLHDQACQRVLSSLIDASGEEEDRYVVQGGILSGNELKKQLNLFHHRGTIRLMNVLHRKGGITYTKGLQNAVYSKLFGVWPDDMIERFGAQCFLDEGLQERADERNFNLSADECASCLLTSDLENTLDEMYSKAYVAASLDSLPERRNRP